jgi:uncharacterized protein YkwD
LAIFLLTNADIRCILQKNNSKSIFYTQNSLIMYFTFLFALFLLTTSSPAQKKSSPSKKVARQVTVAVSEEERQAALEKHNAARAEVGTPPLEWSDELSAYAQEWANYLVREHNGAMQHRPSSGKWKQLHGENIFSGWGKDYSLLDATNAWYAEIKDYTYAPLSGSNWYKTGHYTQMIWRTTTHIGMAKAVTADGKIIIVANYSPAGNMMGEKPY